jgi:hypothetical protein
VFATGYRNIIRYNSNGINFNASSVDYSPGYELLIAVISAGIGLGFGVLAGIIIVFLNGHNREDLFNDREHWINDDGLSNFTVKEEDDVL